MGRSIGDSLVADIGFGCMGLSWAYAPQDGSWAEKTAVLHHALDAGVTLLDTADFYGPYINEELVGDVLRTRRDDVFVSTKGGLAASDEAFMSVNGRPEHLRTACDASLKRLGIDRIDLYQLHRVDPDVPLEESWGAMAELATAGKVRNVGLCEVSADQCRRAAAIHPVRSVQSELSIWERNALDTVLPWCRSSGAAFIAFSPLGRGFLTGTMGASTTFSNSDFRASNPRFSPEAIAQNQRVVDVIAGIARELDATAAQVALAWLLRLDPAVIPIPGTRKPERIDENMGALKITLSDDQFMRLSSVEPPSQPRY
jgi:aryl-alcohol dehydrogenase-like predicted oxidoreductase